MWAKTATSRPIHFMFDSDVAGIFGDGGSNGSMSGLKKSKMAAAAILEKFQMAISPPPQPVVRSTSCLFLGWFFGDGGTNGSISGLRNPRWRPPPSWKKIQMAISPQPIVRSTLCCVLGWGFLTVKIAPLWSLLFFCI